MTSVSMQCRVLTAPGRGAVAVIQISACDESLLFHAFDHLFQPGSLVTPRTAPAGRILYGHWGLEDVVLVRCRQSCENRQSSTAPLGTVADASPAVWEVHCHGGTLAVDSILASLQPYLSDSSHHHTKRLEDLLNESLIQTTTQQSAAWILRQMDGRLAAGLSSILSLIDNSPMTQQRAAAQDLIDRILRWQWFAHRLLNPARILIAGPPNAGKSSLINRLVGFDRSIVFDQPGTTRDLVEASTVIDGWPLLFVDSAGLRTHTNDPIEAQGMRAVRAIAASCDSCLLVQDASLSTKNAGTENTSSTFMESDDSGLPIESLIQSLPSKAAILRVANKADLLSKDQLDRFKRSATSPSDFLISAITGSGIEELLDAIITTIIPEIPDESAVIPANPAISSVLEQLNADLKSQTSPKPELIQTLKVWLN